MTARRALGVDACRAGWVGVVLDTSFSSASAPICVAATLVELVAGASPNGRPDIVAVDMPIGLPDTSRRQADVLARAQLGRRRSSLFMTPVRAALDEETHARASAVNRDRAGEGISVQAFNLRPKLMEVEAFAVSGAYRVVEVHSEVSFARLAGHPLPYAKKTPEGQRLRRSLLRQAGIRLVKPATVGLGVGLDDVLDAAVAAWSGRRVLLSEAVSLPDVPEVFTDGWSSAIWV
ncbi:MAG: DUF429 domain-containing protein [Lapillicoccus sp.]